MTIRAVSFGGGVQSTALLVLAARGDIDFPLFLFANVGDQSENPDTLTYIAEHSAPYAAAHGVELAEVAWVDKTGRKRDLYEDLLASKRDIAIPLRLGSGAFGNRKCTARYKIEVVGRELKRRGATVDNPAVVGLGISTDEIWRAKVGVPKQQPWTTRVNPLLDLGLSRSHCHGIIDAAGLPQPPKSSCSFCPFQSPEQWRRQRENHPELYERNAALDDELRARHVRLRGDAAGLAHASIPLRDISDQQTLDLGDCDGGWCMT